MFIIGLSDSIVNAIHVPIYHVNTIDMDAIVPFQTCYGVASIGRLLEIKGLFCKKSYKKDDILQKRPII